MIVERYSRCMHLLKYIFFIIIFFTVSCAQVDTSPDKTRARIGEHLSESDKNKSIEILEDLLSGNIVKPNNIKKINVEVDNIPAKAFFIGLMADLNENIVTHPDVSGNITLKLDNVTLLDIMNVLRDMYGYEYKITNNIYSVYPKTLRTEIFEVNYLDVKREGVTDSSVSIGTIQGGNQQGGQNQNNSQLSNGSNNQSNNAGGQGNDITSGARVSTSSQTDYWEELKKTLSLVIDTNSPGKKVTVNAQAGLVIVTALPKEINAVRRLLKHSEKNIQKQVIIEAKIIEVNLFKSFEAGINWSIIEGSYGYVFESSFERVSESGLNGLTEGIANTTSEMFSSVLGIGDLTQLVSLLEQQGAVQVLSSPRVSTVNNQKALIRVGSDEFFVTGISNQTTTSAAATSTAPNIELSSFFSGISLDVTPQISDGNEVVLHVHPVVSTVSDQQKNIQLGDEDFSLPLALREIRESDSIVKAKSGQVIVLGGLMQESSNNLKGKRPLIGNIPLLKMLFKTKSKLSRKSELVILLRPIVVDKDSFQDDIRQSYDRIGGI